MALMANGRVSPGVIHTVGGPCFFTKGSSSESSSSSESDISDTSDSFERIISTIGLNKANLKK